MLKKTAGRAEVSVSFAEVISVDKWHITKDIGF